MRRLGLVLMAVACERAPKAPETAPARPKPLAQNSALSESRATTPTASAKTASQAAPELDSGVPCGALDCRAFETEALAFEHVLKSKPRVLGVGEAHAQKGTEHVTSATQRFAKQLLPLLSGRASDLVIELLIADGSCKQQQTSVAEKQKAVTKEQARENQNEFVLLGNEAKRIGMTPHALRPNCEQYQRIAAAGAADISYMLELIAIETERTLKSLLERRPESLIVTYGGALHNDVSPRPGKEAWSFGPQLMTHTGDRYLELDLIVPEYIKDTEAWRALPWFSHFNRDQHRNRTVVYNPSPGSFVLIFPRTPRTLPENRLSSDAAPEK